MATDAFNAIFENAPKQVERDTPSPTEDIMRGLKRAPFRVAGFPLDVANIIQNISPMYVGNVDGYNLTTQIPTSETLIEEARRIPGVNLLEPQTGFGQAAETIGAGGTVGVGKGLLKYATTPGGPLRRGLELLKPTVAETSIAGGAVAGRELGEQFTDDPAMLFASELVGGGGVATGLGASTRTLRGVQTALDPVLNNKKVNIGGKEYSGGVANITQDLFRNSLDDVDQELARLSYAKSDALVPKTTADLLDNPVLKGTERSVQKVGEGRSPLAASNATQRAIALEQDRIESVGRVLSSDGNPQNFTSELLARKNALSAKIENYLNKTKRSTRNILGEQDEPSRTAFNSIVSKSVIERNLKIARDVENRAWIKARDKANNLNAETQVIKDNMNTLIESQEKNISPKRKVPERILKKVNDLEEVETLGELQALRSDILDESRKARAQGNFDRARKLNDMQSGILDHIMANDPSGRLREAMKESALVNETYHQGVVGRILGFKEEGTGVIGDSETLSLVLSGGDEVADKINGFLLATGDQGQSMLREQMMTQFRNEAIDPITNEVDLAKAKAFLKSNDMALGITDLRNTLMSAVRRTQQLDDNIAQRSKTLKGVNERSQAAVILNADDPRIEIRTILNSKDSEKRVTNLYNSAKSKESKEGLSRLIYDELVERSVKELDTGRKKIDLVKLTDSLNRKEFTRFLDDGAKSRLKRMLAEMKKIRRIEKEAPRTPLSFESESQLTDLLAAVLGARAGAAIGGKTSGATIQAAGRGSRLTRSLISQIDQSQVISLMEEALFDPDVFRTLMMRTTRKNDVVRIMKLRGHLADMNNDLVAIEEENVEQPEMTFNPETGEFQ